MNKKQHKLTAKEEAFCYHYCLDFNATKAALLAGYSPKSARQIGSENLSKPYIQQEIKRLQDNLAETAGVSALRIIEEHKKIAFMSIAHLHNTWIDRKDFEELTDEQKACIKSIQVRIKKMGDLPIAVSQEISIDVPIEVQEVKVELWDKQKALEQLAKLLGLNAPDKTEIGITDKTPNRIKIINCDYTQNDIND